MIASAAAATVTGVATGSTSSITSSAGHALMQGTRSSQAKPAPQEADTSLQSTASAAVPRRSRAGLSARALPLDANLANMTGRLSLSPAVASLFTTNFASTPQASGAASRPALPISAQATAVLQQPPLTAADARRHSSPALLFQAPQPSAGTTQVTTGRRESTPAPAATAATATGRRRAGLATTSDTPLGEVKYVSAANLALTPDQISAANKFIQNLSAKTGRTFTAAEQLQIKQQIMIGKATADIDGHLTSSFIIQSPNGALVVGADTINLVPRPSTAAPAATASSGERAAWKIIRALGTRTASAIGTGLILAVFPTDLGESDAGMEWTSVATVSAESLPQSSGYPAISPQLPTRTEFPAHTVSPEETTQTTPMHTPSRDDTIVSQYGSSQTPMQTARLFTPMHDSRPDDGLMFRRRENVQNPDHKYYPAPEFLQGFPDAIETKRMSDRTRWKLPNKKILEWDRLHGEIEMYDRTGNHLGAFDPITGEKIKEAVRGRKIEI